MKKSFITSGPGYIGHLLPDAHVSLVSRDTGVEVGRGGRDGRAGAPVPAD